MDATRHNPLPLRIKEFAMAAGEMSQAQFTSFLNTACFLLSRFGVGGSLHYICMDWRHMSELLAATCDVYTELKNVCVWVKNHTGMGGLYRSRHELIFVFKKWSRGSPQQRGTRPL